jgi:hypothetical protein
MSRPECPVEAGQRFNPHRRFIELMIPVSLVMLVGKGGLSWFDLILYGRLKLHKAKDAETCWVRRETLARELNAGLDTVDRGLTALKRAGLIEAVRHGRGRENEYAFLWSDTLAESLRACSDESADLRSQTADKYAPESARLRSQKRSESADLPPLSPQICGSESADLRSHYKEEKIPEKIPEKISSSSEYVEGSTATTTMPISASKPKKPEPDQAGAPDGYLIAGRTTKAEAALRELLVAEKYPVPDGEFPSTELAGLFTDTGAKVADFRAAVEAIASRTRKDPPITWRYWLRAIRNELPTQKRRRSGEYPEIGGRERFLRRVDRETENTHDEPANGPEYPDISEVLRERDAERERRQVPRPKKPDCSLCQDEGTIHESTGVFSSIRWCDCAAAERRKAAEELYVDKFNADMAAIAKRFERFKPRAADPDGGLPQAGQEIGQPDSRHAHEGAGPRHGHRAGRLRSNTRSFLSFGAAVAAVGAMP